MVSKKFLITTAQASYHENCDGDIVPYGHVPGRKVFPKAKPHKHLLEGFEKYCEVTGAELIILPTQGQNALEDILHEDLRDRPEVFTGQVLKLNKNVQIRDLIVPPQNVDPATGKASMVSKYNSSIIFPHTKQRFFPVPVFNSDLPRYLYTTGAVTMPNYNTHNHKGDTAERNHVFGGLVVEVVDNTFFNIRPIKALKNGKFVDLGLLYDGNKKPVKIGVDSMIVGDYHNANKDETAVQATYDMIKQFKPSRIFLHDFFDGESVNHHESDNQLKRARLYREGRLNLRNELSDCYKEIVKLSKMVPGEVNVVSSNHDAFLPRYINEGVWFKHDLWNSDIGAYLYQMGIQLELPEDEIDDASYLLEAGMSKFGDIPDNVNFLRLKDSYRRHGFQLASHGHKGANGARGGKAKAREITGGGKSISGHSHVMEMYGDTYIVGTNSRLGQSYTAGSGNASIAANAILYSNGIVQLIPIIHGRWKV